MSDITIEIAAPADAAQCAVVLRTTWNHSLAFLSNLHSPDEDVLYFAEHVFPRNTVMVALDGAHKIAGFIAFADGWVNHLYVRPEFQRLGIGQRLLEEAKRQFSKLKLWTFERNTGARRFYEREGFLVVMRTDGAQNEEKEPDVLFEWNR